MMQECPRCGFVQPEDQYCANCGLDIKNYNPVKPPLHKQLLQNSTLLLAVMVVVILAAVAAIYRHQAKNIEEQIAESPPPPVTTTQAQPEPAASPPPPVTATKTKRTSVGTKAKQTPAKVETKPVSPTEQALAQLQTLEASSGREAGETTQAVAAAPTNINLKFGEVPRASLDNFLQSGRVISETGSEKITAVPYTKSVNSIGSEVTGFQFLPGGGNKKISTTDPMNFEYISTIPSESLERPDEELGMSLQILPNSLRGDQVSVEVSGILSLRDEASGDIVSLELNGNYEFNSKQLLVVSGFVPKQRVPETDVNYFSSSPLNILSSDDFLNNISEFVILLQLK